MSSVYLYKSIFIKPIINLKNQKKLTKGIILFMVLFLLGFPFFYYIFAFNMSMNNWHSDNILSFANIIIKKCDGIAGLALKGEYINQNGIFVAYILSVLTIMGILLGFLYIILAKKYYENTQFSSSYSKINIFFIVFGWFIFFIGGVWLMLCYGLNDNSIKYNLSLNEKISVSYIGVSMYAISISIIILFNIIIFINFLFAWINHIKFPTEHKYILKKNSHHNNCRCIECQNMSK